MVTANIDLTFSKYGSAPVHLCRKDFENYSQAVEWYNVVMRNFSVSRLRSVSLKIDML